MMIKIWMGILLCFKIVTVNAQIEMADNAVWTKIGKLKSLGTTLAKLEYRVAGRDTLYFLLMKDFKKQQETNYFSLSFNGNDNTCSKFYELLMSFFMDENKKNRNYMKTFRLGNDGVNLQHCTLIARHGVRLTTKEGYINLSEKDIEKLFGKR